MGSWMWHPRAPGSTPTGFYPSRSVAMDHKHIICTWEGSKSGCSWRQESSADHCLHVTMQQSTSLCSKVCHYAGEYIECVWTKLCELNLTHRSAKCWRLIPFPGSYHLWIQTASMQCGVNGRSIVCTPSVGLTKQSEHVATMYEITNLPIR